MLRFAAATLFVLSLTSTTAFACDMNDPGCDFALPVVELACEMNDPGCDFALPVVELACDMSDPACVPTAIELACDMSDPTCDGFVLPASRMVG